MNSGLPPGFSNGPAACKLSCELCPNSGECTNDGEANSRTIDRRNILRTPTSLYGELGGDISDLGGLFEHALFRCSEIVYYIVELVGGGHVSVDGYKPCMTLD